jgi:hypothetical protein
MTYKVFVKYQGGSGGQILSTILLSLMEPVNIVDNTIKTIHAEHIVDLRHTFKLIYPISIYKNTHAILTPDENGNTKVEKLLKLLNIEYFETSLPAYIIPTHWEAIHKISLYIENSRVIHVCLLNEEDYAQTMYNVTHKVYYFSNTSDQIKKTLAKELTLYTHFNRIKEKYSNKLKNINRIDDIDPDDPDSMRLLTWINRFGQENFDRLYDVPLPPHVSMRVNFRDIHTGNIINQLDELAAFIGIEHLSDDRRNNAIEIINKYVAGQKDIPWKLSIDDY